ncbi:glycosyltransferase family 2 protein [Cohnella luojiensis]|uniref:Glycosyltransferase family 2 protein n=1 Tax=Cohnella luojiensis TaxID=652876 RepID=A0A4Y8M1M2_9BACL|nr:glycosyltransferase family 2 protein [Cohnella luojiensis]TFE29007.1 glycosyltransferase family 2 protein [Cohnella luojiensis]
MIETTVIIPNYNGEAFLKECLDSLAIQIYKDFEVIIVDNASSDNSLSIIENFKLCFKMPVTIICNETNLGFCKAVNDGIRRATGEYVVLLNSDTVATPSWLQQLVKLIKSDENIFSCASKMIQYHDKSKIDDAGDFYSLVGWAFQEGHGKSIDKFNKNRKIFSSCAGAAVYRKSILEIIGYFDETFFAYLEDVDIGYRATIEGYKNMYCSTALIYHIGSASTGGGYSNFKVKQSAQNNILLIYKNMPLLQILINSPYLLIGVSIKYLYFLRKGYRAAYVEGLLSGFRKIKSVQKVKFNKKNLPNYLLIEILLAIYTVKYSAEKSCMKLKKLFN